MTLTGNMVRDLYAEQAKPGAVLLSITGQGLAEPFLATSWPGGLAADDTFYPYVPFTMDWPGSGEGEPSRAAKLVVHASGEAVEMIRLVTGGQPECEIKRVRVVAPNVAERALRKGTMTSATLEGGTINIPINGRDYAKEPAVGARYTIGRTPGNY
jgi:hypothetical protein